MDKDTLRFIDSLYKDLYLSDEVLHHSTGDKSDKFRNLKEYFEMLKDLHDRASISEHRKDLLKRLYHNKYVIKPEDIPESYYKMQERIALERGFGHVEITDEQKKELQNEVIKSQEKSLDVWLDYFLSDDSKVYPFWAKYWAFQGMLKLGIFNKENGSFNRRTKDTVAPFADLNQEALSLSIDFIIKAINKENIDDKDLETMVKGGSFQRIYTYVLTKVLTNNQNITKRNEGKWVKYKMKSDHMLLFKSLQGYNTGWCTAGSENIAKMQLDGGDFYVYYTLDEKGEYKIPRIAIRMGGHRIGEIRGIGKDQNLEPEMEKVVEEKIKDFPDKDEYYKKVSDMKKLTEIYNKQNNNIELSDEELRFLYELDEKIIGFGYEKDPRIEEIRNKRGIKIDIAKIYNCNENEVAIHKAEINEKTAVYYGVLYFLEFYPIASSSKNRISPKMVIGDMHINGIKSAKGLVLPEVVTNNLSLYSLEDADGLVFPKTVGGSLSIDRLKTAKNLVLPETVGEALKMYNLTSAEGLVLPKTVGDYLDLCHLDEVKDITFPNRVDGCLYLTRLFDGQGIVLPKYVGKLLDLEGLITAKGMVLPEFVGGDLLLNSLVDADGLILPKTIGGSLTLGNFRQAHNVTFPEEINGNLFMNYLVEASNLVFPKKVGGFVAISMLNKAENVVFPKEICGSLNLHSLNSASNIVLPEIMDGDLCLDNLKTVDRLVLPKEINSGMIYLNSNVDFDKLVWPNSLKALIVIDGAVDMYYSNLESVKEALAKRNKK